ncbi:MAG TPA: tRNA (adenosine(37)-N6)-threonylcarbamoyltransferase complex dimerization subunit type 1 TsaB [Gemmatimonadaceae bacterium]|nr:tRNA (adenosine(37)-N6)-threonylcarbamoyltransferase complex dimerization subunit type 1 TsaB [Gemmatimonadaceae bacterium]
MITLALDASTYEGDVCAIVDGAVVAEASVAMKGAHEERLMPAVADVLERAKIRTTDLDRIVCGAGPGSFTSLRIAGAIAKGIATGTGKPLYAVPSLALIVAAPDVRPGRYLAAIDALRGEYYVALYDRADSGRVDELETARVVAAGDVEQLAHTYDGAIISPSRFADGAVSRPRAASVVNLEAMLATRGPVDIASWEPSYGRLAEAQVRWESAHGKPLPTG